MLFNMFRQLHTAWIIQNKHCANSALAARGCNFPPSNKVLLSDGQTCLGPQNNWRKVAHYARVSNVLFKRYRLGDNTRHIIQCALVICTIQISRRFPSSMAAFVSWIWQRMAERACTYTSMQVFAADFGGVGKLLCNDFTNIFWSEKLVCRQVFFLQSIVKLIILEVIYSNWLTSSLAYSASYLSFIGLFSICF